VKTAAAPELVRCAVGAAVNARDLLDDAEFLSGAARNARAYAMAALAVEESGKAVSLAAHSADHAGPVGVAEEDHVIRRGHGFVFDEQVASAA